MNQELPENFVLLYSELASKNHRTYGLRAKDGNLYSYNYIAKPPQQLGRPSIIPYFHDAVVIATLSKDDIALSRGSNERPEIHSLVKRPEPPKVGYWGPFPKKDAPKPLIPRGFM
jgi:hypothetical protein